jgi:hypothetical protein
MAGRTTGGRGSSSALVYVDEKSVRDLQNLAKAIKAQGEQKPSMLTKMLHREIVEAAEPMRADIATAAERLNFTREGRASISRSSKGRRLKSGKRAKKRGLRAEIAFGVRTQIDKGKYTAGVRVRLASKQEDVNLIGKRINQKGEVRHPVRYGPRWQNQNRKIWRATKTTNGKGWFYRAADPHRAIVSRRVQRVLDNWTRKMAREISRVG